MNKEEQELIKNCKIWIDEEDINYTRWFGLNELAILIKLIEKLRIKNGKEFARGMETNEKSWKAKINNKLKELAKKLVEPNDDRWEKDDDLYYEKIKARINVLKDLKGE